MKIYESSGSVKQQVGGGGFNPVSEPDVASAMERELRAGERRDQAYFNSIGAKGQAEVRNAQAAADKINSDIDANLKVLGQFSKTITDIADSRIANAANKRMEEAALAGFMYPDQAEQATQEFEQQESAIEKGQGVMDQAAVKYEENGGSPIVGEALRTQFTGRDRVAFETARMQRLSYDFPSYYAEKLSYINGTQDPNVRQARELEVVNAFLREKGAVGTAPGLMNKYLLRPMRSVTSKAQLAWTTQKETEILNGRLDQANSELWTGLTPDNISEASSA